ncbi:hypothetical protein GpartN1_g409.t1 [Galdieria partita]|uniref:Uncharacterized protein n=1 Tax=Galdieria partita TaxID=83374 RepID=A0A9C7UMH3_9RHOD|nr:hypothetical protein GpartN1_g409.t1 [Galdieria partita]
MEQSLSTCASRVTSRRLELRERIVALNSLFVMSENNQRVPSSWEDFVFRGCLDCLEQASKQRASLETETNNLWKILERLCQKNPSCIPDLVGLPDLIEKEMGEHLSEERLKSIQNILCSMIMERLTLDILTRLVTVLSQKVSSSVDRLTSCWSDVFCICLASLLKVILLHLKGKSGTKTSLDNQSKELLLSLLAWRFPCCTLDPCPSYDLRKQTVRRLVFCTVAMQNCYVVGENSYRYEALEWIVKHSRLEMLPSALKSFVQHCLDAPNKCIVQSAKEDSSNHKRRRVAVTEKDDRQELLMEIGTLLIERYAQDNEINNKESWMQVFITFLQFLENYCIVLDSIWETEKQSKWKEALAVMSCLLESHLCSHLIAWQGMLSLSNISFSIIAAKTEQVITSVAELEEDGQLWKPNGCVFVQLICRILMKYSEWRQLNIFLDKLCTNIVSKSLYLIFLSSFQSSLVLCLMKTTPEEFSDCFDGILNYLVTLYEECKSSEEYEKPGKKERSVLYLQLIFLLLKSLIQKMSNQEASTFYWNCLNKTFEKWILPYLMKDEKHIWLSEVECCLLVSAWMTCECHSFLLFPSSHVKIDYLEQLVFKLDELVSEHSFEQFSFSNLSTCAYGLELFTNYLSTRCKYLQGTSRKRWMSKHKLLERLVIKRWIIPCTIAVRDYLCVMKWNDRLTSFQTFEHLWMSLQHIASYLLSIPSKKYEKKYFSVWAKLFFPLLLVASSHCYISEESRTPQWILDDWSDLVTRLLDWSIMEILWERKHFRNKLLEYWKCVIRQLCFHGELVSTVEEESSRTDLWLRPFTESLSTFQASTLLHYLWNHGIVSMVLRFPWMLSKSFLNWIGQHYVSLCMSEKILTRDTTWKMKLEKFLCDIYLCRNIHKYSYFLSCIVKQPAILCAIIPYVPYQVQVSQGWLSFVKWLSKRHSDGYEQLHIWLLEMMEPQCNSSQLSSDEIGLFYLVITFWHHSSHPQIRKVLKETIFRWIQHLWVVTDDRSLRIEALCLVLQHGKKKNDSLFDRLRETLDRGFKTLRQDIIHEDTLSNYNPTQARRFLHDYFLWKREAVLSQLSSENELNSLLAWFLQPLGHTILSEQEFQLRQLCSISFWKQVLESFWLQWIRNAVSNPTEFLIASRLCYVLLLSTDSDWERERRIILEMYRLLFAISITEDNNMLNTIHTGGASAVECLAFVASKVHYSNFVEEYEDAMSNLFLLQRWYLERKPPFLADVNSVPWEHICKIFSRSVEKLRKSSRYPVYFVCNYALKLTDLLLKEAEPFSYVTWIHRLWEPILGWMRKGLSTTWLTWFLFQVVDLVEQQKPSLFNEPLFIVELCKLLHCKPEETVARGNLIHPKESVMENIRSLLQRYSERYKYKGKA